MRFNGYDSFTFPPDTKEEIKCRVCGQICDVKRGVVAATSFGEAMAHQTHAYDTFDCPNRDEPWHEQAKKLVFEIEEDTSSFNIKRMKKALKKIVKNRKV